MHFGGYTTCEPGNFHFPGKVAPGEETYDIFTLLWPVRVGQSEFRSCLGLLCPQV